MTDFQNCFFGNIPSRPAFWFMRQAGRYLPEYRAVREGIGSFLDLCYTPEKAVEVTLQPVTRFGMDAAIIFSDILVIPHALGMDVGFVNGEGPRLTPLTHIEGVKALSGDVETFLAPVYEAIRQTREKLSEDKSLIGFSGAPWTLACYMLEGQGGGDFEAARRALYVKPELVLVLVDVLVDAISRHLIAQVQAGADAVQLFDSWAGVVPAEWQQAMILSPTQRIVQKVKQVFPHIPIIGFPRGQGVMLGEYVEKTGVSGVSIDTATSLAHVLKVVPERCVIQGNLDPLLLATDMEKAIETAKKIIKQMQGRRFIFNLGHGVVPDTPVEHVAALAKALKNG